MAEPIIVPTGPAVGSQSEAFAGASAVVFTATDRKVIEERGGAVDQNKTFKEVIYNKGLIPEVENEETNIQPETNVTALESRQKDHQRMLRYSAVQNPKERVEISKEARTAGEIIPDLKVVAEIDKARELVMISEEKADLSQNKGMKQETAALIKELNFSPSELYDKLALEQEALHALVYKIKELHLKRFLCNDQKDFEELTREIEKETLAAGKAEAKEWLAKQLGKLALEAAEYKYKLMKSLQAMEYDESRSLSLKWLEKKVKQLSAG